MKRQFVSLLLLLLTTVGTVFGNDNRPRMSLAGTWMLALDNDSLFNDTISLPGTTDTNQKGILITDKSVTTRLSRQYSYEGKAWYKRCALSAQSRRASILTAWQSSRSRTSPPHKSIIWTAISLPDGIRFASWWITASR